jgi:hypothetical protein
MHDRPMNILHECWLSFAARNPLTTVFLELPVSVVQRTDLPSLQPSGDAVEMKGVLRSSC